MGEVDLRQVLDGLPDAVVASDAGGHLTYANDEAGALFGRSRDALVGQPVVALVPERLRARYQRLLSRAFGRGATRTRRFDAVLEVACGEEIDVSVSSRPLAGGGMVATLRRGAAREGRQDRLGQQLCAAANLATALASSFDRDRIASLVADTLVRELGATLGAVWLCDPTTGQLALRARSGEGTPPPLPEAPLEGRPVVLCDPAGDARVDGEWVARERLQAVAIAPLTVGHEGYGVLVAGFRRPVPPDLESALGGAAAMITASLRDLDLLDREAAARARLTSQLDVARALAHAQTHDEALAAVLGVLGEHLAWDVARFWRVDEDARVLRNVAAWRAGDSGQPTKRTYGPGEGGPGLVWQSGAPLWIGDGADPLPVQESIEGLHGVFWFPVQHRGEVKGVLELFSAVDRPPHDQLLETMGGLGDQLGQFLERAGIEEQLRASEERLTTTLKSIADAVIATDVRGRVTFMNSVAEQLTGWPFDDARGRPLAEVFRVVSEDDREPLENPVSRVIRDGLVVGFGNHTALIARRGEIHSIEDSGAPIRGEDGALYGVVLVFRDVTQLRRADRRRRLLAQAAATLASSIDYGQTLSNVAHLAVPRLADWCVVHVIEDERVGAVPLAVAHVDPSKASQARALAERYPSDPESPDGLRRVLRTLEPALVPDITDEHLAASARDAEHLRILRDLRMRSTMIVPLVAHGRAIGAISFVTADSAHRYDEADLAMAEELAARAALAIDNARLHRSLRDGEEKTRLVLEAVGEAIVGVDLRGSCVFANPAAARLLGFASPDDLVGRDIRDLAHPSPDGAGSGRPPPPFALRIDELCLENEPAHVPEERLGRPDGSGFWAECWSYPIARAGQRVGAVVTFIDITERKRAEGEHQRVLRELEDAVHLRDDFLSIASHELRTPLTPLQLHVQGIQRALRRGPDAISTAEILSRLDSVARQISRIERLVDSLLDIARITSKRVVLQPEPVELVTLVKDVVARHKDELVRSGTSVTVEADGAVVGRWDRLRFDQVVSNLLSNAMKFGSGQPIEIKVVLGPGGDALLSITDHGIGIAGEDQRRIFERFERAVPSRHYGGFGLGLWIVRQIIAAMGGTVQVTSHPGEGATFTVDVPLRDTEAHALAS